MSVYSIQQAITANSENKERSTVYNKTKSIEKYIEVDEVNHFWKVPVYQPFVIFRYSDIVSFELIENGESITKGGLGSAIIGGALFGSVGTIVGGTIGKKKTQQEVTEYRIKIVTKCFHYQEIYINFLATGKVKSGSLLYNSYATAAQKILSLLSLITTECTALPESSANSISAADEIMKFKQLLDGGIITQEEFNEKKKQLLNL